MGKPHSSLKKEKCSVNVGIDFFPTWTTDHQTKMADVGTLFSKENVKIIENIFNVEFEKQEKNIVNLISANLKFAMDEIKNTQDEMKKLGKEVTYLKQSLEFKENVPEEKVKKLDEKHVNLKNQCNELYNNTVYENP